MTVGDSRVMPGLDMVCPDCRAEAGVECHPDCSTFWTEEEESMNTERVMSDPVTLTLTLSDEDFGRLTDNSMHWRTVNWIAQADRFETTVGRDPYADINFEHEMAYWVGDSSVAMLMARAYIEARGFQVQVLWDLAEHPNGELFGYVLTTDYVADWWRNQ